MSEITCACCEDAGEIAPPIATSTCDHCLKPICSQCDRDGWCCMCWEDQDDRIEGLTDDGKGNGEDWEDSDFDEVLEFLDQLVAEH